MVDDRPEAGRLVVITDHRKSHLPAATKAALAWADVVLGNVTGPERDETLHDLRAHFDDSQILELTYVIGTFIGYSKQIITLGLEPDDLPVLVIPTPGGA